MKAEKRNAFLITAAAVLTIILMIALLPRLLRVITDRENGLFTLPVSSSDETPEEASSTRHQRETSREAFSTTFETAESVSYPAESLPDYEVHTLPQTTEESTTEAPEPAKPTETTVLPETTAPAESPDPADTSAEPVPTETSTDFSENSDNLPFVGTWILEYDLAPAQETALKARYELPRVPEKPLILRLSAVLADGGTLRLIYTQEDDEAFKSALADWYAEAASIHAETGANGIQKAAFLSWAAYRKGIYALLSPDTVNKLDAGWYARGTSVFVTDEGTIQAEIFSEFDSEGLTVTEFRIANDDFRDTVLLMQETLGFTAPYHLTKK